MSNNHSDAKYGTLKGPVVKYSLKTVDWAGVKVEPFLAMKIDDSIWIPVQGVFDCVRESVEISFASAGGVR